MPKDKKIFFNTNRPVHTHVPWLARLACLTPRSSTTRSVILGCLGLVDLTWSIDHVVLGLSHISERAVLCLESCRAGASHWLPLIRLRPRPTINEHDAPGSTSDFRPRCRPPNQHPCPGNCSSNYSQCSESASVSSLCHVSRAFAHGHVMRTTGGILEGASHGIRSRGESQRKKAPRFELCQANSSRRIKRNPAVRCNWLTFTFEFTKVVGYSHINGWDRPHGYALRLDK